RFSRDWSSDVCSSDLHHHDHGIEVWRAEEKAQGDFDPPVPARHAAGHWHCAVGAHSRRRADQRALERIEVEILADLQRVITQNRSEERRVGKEYRIQW